MKSTLTLRVLLILAVFGLTLPASSALSPDRVVENYCTASENQRNALNGASMEVRIEASLPKLKKRGRLQALRHISWLGRITYDVLRFEGDATVKSNVIARYLTAEAQSQSDKMPSMAVTPGNYKFKFKRMTDAGGRSTYVFLVNPRKKRVGLYKGELWIDADTYLRVQESGRLVKNPSIFLKKVEFVRTYEIRDGISVPRQIQSVVDTRLVGPAELTVDFSNYSLGEGSQRADLTDGGDR